MYRYIQDRAYRVDLNPDTIEYAYPVQHAIFERDTEGINVDDIYISVFRAPMEVVTKGYFEIDPHVLSATAAQDKYHSISDSDVRNKELAKQTYRRYGEIDSPAYTTESEKESTHLNVSKDGALMMSIRLTGKFGADINKTMLLAAVMLNELLHTMFPYVADSIAVCPILNGEMSDDETQTILKRQPELSVIGENKSENENSFNLLIIEDCTSDIGVVSVLHSAGDNILNTLFEPVYRYLEWYLRADAKSEYLYYGLDHEPSCFDFVSLCRLSKLLSDTKHDLKFSDIDSVIEYAACDFCGKHYKIGQDLVKLDDGRIMCKECAENLAGNNNKVLRSHFERAKIFMESTYGIIIDDYYEVCFDSAVKIINALDQDHTLSRRGSDIPLKSYVDKDKKIHLEDSIPSANLSELIVREITHVWQLRYLPELDEELAEGQIAIVAIQYLRFLNQNSLADVRTNYYESTGNPSGEGYRKLVRALLENEQFNNNPFRYLLETLGKNTGDVIFTPHNRIIENDDFGLPYVPEQTDRESDGNINYFYYSNLTSDQQKTYDLLLDAIKNHMAEITVEGCSFEDISKLLDAVSYDHPELFWYNTFSMQGKKVIFFYGASEEESSLLQKRIDEASVKYLEGIDDSMSAYDAAIRIHANIIAAVDYDTIALNRQKQSGGPKKDKIDYLRTICGAILDGKAVCEGYTRAMQYLLQKCGIESAEIVGYVHKENNEKDVPHAWNLVKIDGDYYHIDATWDDSSNTVQSVKKNNLMFDYFCITTDEISRTRDTELCPLEVPVCTAVKANYFYHNDLVIGRYDLDKIKSIARKAAENNKKSFMFKCRSKSVYDTALNEMCADGRDCYEVLKAAAKQNKQILTNTYSYTYDKNIWTITIKFKFNK